MGEYSPLELAGNSRPGGEQAVHLKVAEQAVSAYSRVAADANTTLVLPAGMEQVGGLVATAMQLAKASKG